MKKNIEMKYFLMISILLIVIVLAILEATALNLGLNSFDESFNLRTNFVATENHQ